MKTKWTMYYQKRKMRFFAKIALGMLIGAAVAVPTTSAQETGDAEPQTRSGGSLEMITVTARKRVEPLQATPIAVTALTGQDLQLRFPTDLKSLEFPAPNVNFARLSSFTNAVTIFIRGIGNADNDSTVDPPVALFVDGIYVPRPENSSLDMFDIEQVEIMRGPQGTLFGRNTTAGAIHLRTRRPSGEFMTRGRLTIGNAGRFDVRASVDLPVIEGKLDAKLSVLSTHLDGFYKRPDDSEFLESGKHLGKEDTIAVRPTIQFTPNEEFTFTLIGEYVRVRSSPTPQTNGSSATQVLCAVWGFCGETIDEVADKDDFFISDPNVHGVINNEVYGITAEMEWDVGPGTITSVSNYRKTDSFITLDIDNTPAPMFETWRTSPHKQASSELRFASTAWDRFDFITGVFFFYQKHFLRRDTFLQITPGPTTRLLGFTEQKHYNVSGFLEGNYHATDRLTVTLGGRFTWEKKTFYQEPFGLFPNAGARITPDPETWNNFSPKVGLDYQFTDTVMAYASWSRGFKSGGFNGRGGTPTTLGPFDEEKVDAFEVGLKSDLFNDKLRFNVALFWNEYDDLQRTVIRFLPGAANPQETVTSNAASARIRGVEVEMTALPFEGLQLDAGISYLDAQYQDFCADLNGPSMFASMPTSSCGGSVDQISGEPGGAGLYLLDEDLSDISLQRAPEWQLSLGATYTAPLGNAGNLIFNGRYTYVSRLNVLVDGTDRGLRDPVNLFDASITFEEMEGRYSVSLYGKNLTNEIYLNNVTAVAALFDTYGVSNPRTYGIELSWEL